MSQMQTPEPTAPRVVEPSADVLEGSESLLLVVDLPGVAKEARGPRHRRAVRVADRGRGQGAQQDLALVSAMGLTHVERNGHHFVDGFAGRPKDEAVRFMEAYPDLYADTPRGPRLAIREGMLDLGSVNAAKGLGAAIEPDTRAMEAMPKAAWPPG